MESLYWTVNVSFIALRTPNLLNIAFHTPRCLEKCRNTNDQHSHLNERSFCGGLFVTWLRLSNLYGNYEPPNYLRDITKRQPIRFQRWMCKKDTWNITVDHLINQEINQSINLNAFIERRVSPATQRRRMITSRCCITRHLPSAAVFSDLSCGPCGIATLF